MMSDMPLGPYRDFDDCVRNNQDKESPESYCGALEQEINPDKESAMPRLTLQIVPVAADDSDLLDGEIDDADEVMAAEGIADPAEDFHSLLVVEGVWTGDGRYIEEGSLGWRDLPLPLMATNRTTEGHMDAVLIGNITRIERTGRELHSYGRFVESDDSEILALQSLVRNGELRGVSVDLDAVEYEVIFPSEQAEPEPDTEGLIVMEVDEVRMRILGARIMGATVVPFPAFQEAYIESLAALTASYIKNALVTGYIEQMQSYDDIDFSPPQAARDEAARGLEWRREHGRGGTEVGVARARDISNGKNLSPDTIGRMYSYFSRHEVDKQGQGWSPDQDGYPSAGRIAWALWGGDPGYAWARKVRDQMQSRDSRGSIVASGHPIEAPVCPPAHWFSDPVLHAPTPLTVQDDGRIFGHLAVWGQCHIGYADRCIEPPSSAASYAHFLTGEILCDNGSRLPVGQITMNGPHAPHNANAQQATAHYDNTCLAVADVTAGEDSFGIWVSGALRPDLDPAQIRGLMASDVSGDWRRIGSGLELVAVLAVNVPGFPKVRVRELEGLVASLSIPAYDGEQCSAELSQSAQQMIDARLSQRDQMRKEITQRILAPRIDAIRSRIKGDI